MSAAFMACQKSEVNNPNVVKNEDKGSIFVARAGVEFNRTLYNENSPQDIKCDAPAGNCASEDVIVYGSVHVETFEEIFNIVEGGNSNAISEAFNTYKDILVEYLVDEHVEDVINQQLTVQYRQNSNSNTHFLIFRQGNSVIAAYPIII